MNTKLKAGTTHVLVSPSGGVYSEHRSEQAATKALRNAIKNKTNRQDAKIVKIQ